uniref:Uncharacterized protein n=1 Tax=Oryza meridionalis TaxID=40149 RepID=A0A0E0BWC0_9ORYZ
MSSQMSFPGNGPGASRHDLHAAVHWLGSSSSLQRHCGGSGFVGSRLMLSQHFHGLSIDGPSSAATDGGVAVAVGGGEASEEEEQDGGSSHVNKNIRTLS